MDRETDGHIQTDGQADKHSPTDDWRLTFGAYWSRIWTTSLWPASDAMCRLLLPFCSHIYTHTHTSAANQGWKRL